MSAYASIPETILVTGDGFLAKSVCSLIRERSPATILSTFTQGNGDDVRDYSKLASRVSGSRVVIHTAARTHVATGIVGDHDSRVQMATTNYNGTLNVLAACRKHRARLIHISSCDVYGSTCRPGMPQKEDHPLQPEAGTYAVSKAAADHECRLAFTLHGQDVVVLRPFYLYGPCQSQNKLITRFLLQALNGEPLTVYGGGGQRRDFVYIDDCAAAVWAATKLPAGTVVNVCSGVAYSILDIARRVSSAVSERFKMTATIRHAVGHRGVSEVLGSHELLTKLTGWRPAYSLDRGIIQVLQRIASTTSVASVTHQSKEDRT